MGPVQLGETTWTEVAKAAAAGNDGSTDAAHRGGTEADHAGHPPLIVLIPVGSTEQHGPPLPLATDTIIAEELAGRASMRTDGLVVGPTISVSASGEHAGFAGTLSIGSTVMTDVVVELGRSADWAAGVVFVNGHGGNHPAVTDALEVLSTEGRSALAWWPAWPRRGDGGPPDLHAGRIETSLMLAIDPGLVRLERAVAGPTERGPTETGGGDSDPIDEQLLMQRLRAEGVLAISATGVLGDPAGASGQEGQRFIERFVDDLVHAIERWRPLR
jgi:creatinine amidohydrolase